MCSFAKTSEPKPKQSCIPKSRSQTEPKPNPNPSKHPSPPNPLNHCLKFADKNARDIFFFLFTIKLSEIAIKITGVKTSV